ncbi:MAG: hypothetical protein LC105_10505 [Chitinophagales bacterium]|nr:hypothetical protein [Chitinophagales bacterium]
MHTLVQFKEVHILDKVLIVVLLLIIGTGNSWTQELANIGKQKPFEIHGIASLSVGYYKGLGFQNTRKPYSYSLMAAPTVSIYGIQIPINLTITEGSKSISNPFAQFGINPHWKWIKGYLGTTNMNWTPTTLGGKTFQGVGLELNPSIFRFGGFWGRMNPAVKENLLDSNNIQPQYKRIGWGLKVGLGNEKNYFDLIWVYGKDKDNSIPVPADTLNQLNITPAQNAVMGIKSHQTFGKGKFTWDLDGAISAYTRNTHSQIIDTDPMFGSKFAKIAFPAKLSRGFSWTVHNNFTYKTEKTTLGFDYNRIEPEYQSMGADYLLNDQEKVSLIQAFIVANKKVNLKFDEFYQHDNLNKRKAMSTHRSGLGANINWQLNQKLSTTISYNSFYMFQTSGMQEVNDSTELKQIQNTLLISPQYMIVNSKSTQVIVLSTTYSRLDDFNKFTSTFTDNSTLNMNLMYSLFLIQSGLGIAPSLNILYSKIPLMSLINLSPNISLSKSFFQGKLNTSLTLGYTASSQDKSWNSHAINNTLGVTYRVNSHHSLNFNNSVMYSNKQSSSSQEYKGNFTYTFSF